MSYNGTLGSKGYDPSVLETCRVLDDGKPSPTPTVHGDDSDEIACPALHDDLEPYEDDPMHGSRADGFSITSPSATSDPGPSSAQQLAIREEHNEASCFRNGPYQKLLDYDT